MGLIAGPAHAQVAATVTLASNSLFRGETISRDQPTVSLGLNVEGPDGLYAGASATVTGGPDSPRIATAEQYAGFAKRLGATSIEVGVIHRGYDRIVDEDYRRGFFEGYIGVTRRRLRARFYVSPDYLRSGPPTYYLDLNATLAAWHGWTLEGHGGLSLIPVETMPGKRKLERYQDWRLQVGRSIGPIMLSAGLGATNYPVYSESGRIRAFASALYAF